MRLEMNSLRTLYGLRSQRIVKFLGAGVLNTLFGYGIYAVLVFIGLSYLTALFAATVVGVIFNYFSFGRMVFKANGGWRVFGKFLISYAAVYVMNAIFLGFFTGSEYLNAYLAQAVCIFPSIGISWTLMNHWVYKNN